MRERAQFSTSIRGIPTEDTHERYTTLLLHRLMFLYFIQQKGFLDGDRHYLIHRLHMMQQRGSNLFYRHFLLPLFHEGLHTRSHPYALQQVLGCVPHLGGDIFAVHEIERNLPGIEVLDGGFERLFAFFDRYQWSLSEHPAQRENEITPSILGYIFEKYINQQQMGAYYTREDVTGYIASYTIIPSLFENLEHKYPKGYRRDLTAWKLLREQPDRYIYEVIRSNALLPNETEQEYADRQIYVARLRRLLTTGKIRSIDDFITYNLDIRQFAQDFLRHTENPELLNACYEQLEQMSVLDPTCGSGAFLSAALRVLTQLYTACLERMEMLNCNDGPGQSVGLTDNLVRQRRRYAILKTIITHNLYGVDLMEEATEICKLHLFLQLIAQVERIEDLEPLPDIAHHIRTGNALTGITAAPEAKEYHDGDLSAAELDRILARIHGVDCDMPETFEQWRVDHQPFHWIHEFPAIFRQGGFNVIIGNPPYVEYEPRKFAYTLRDYHTLSCANLYTCVSERSRTLLSEQGRQGMIVPLAAFATRNMIPFIEGFQRWFPCTWLSFYHFRPSMLFSGGKVASIPTAIYLAKAHGQQKRFSTRVNKWPTEQRDLLFSLLTYCPITVPSDPDNRHYYPKFGCMLENTIMERIRTHETVGHYLAQQHNANSMYYRSAGGLYWKIFVNFPWPYATTSNKQCSFQEAYDRDIFVALFNSSLFWWYYTVTFDTFNLKDYMLFGFRFTYPQDTSTINALKTLCQQLMDDFRQNARHLKRGETGSYTVYAKRSKAIIDAIDLVLARHYHFSDEELNFIINYDIKYRMRYGSQDIL